MKRAWLLVLALGLACSSERVDGDSVRNTGRGQGGSSAGQGASSAGSANEAAGDTGSSDGTGDGGRAPGTGTGGGGPGERPLVELLIDGSSSMFEKGMWNAVYATLVTHGLLSDFASTLEIGLSVFRGNGRAVSETSSDCATMTDVAIGASTEAAIDAALMSVQGEYAAGTTWETPTGFAVRHATASLAALDVPAGTRKYLVLVTDGPPDTCEVAAPQCGQDNAIAAVQAARAQGIRTVVLGLVPLLDDDSGCEPASARCGVAYLQDLANAGAGRPVEPPPDPYRFLPCVTGSGLLATYADAGGGDDATYYESADGTTFGSDLGDALAAIFDGRLR